jgi:hypothetical protein
MPGYAELRDGYAGVAQRLFHPDPMSVGGLSQQITDMALLAALAVADRRNSGGRQ